MPTPRMTRKLSRLHQPQEMSLEAWRRELRRQIGREQAFTLKNVGAEPVCGNSVRTAFYSVRKAVAGSIRIARRAGPYTAAAATEMKTTVTRNKVSGSCGLT